MTEPVLQEKHGGDTVGLQSVRTWLRLLSCAMIIEKRLRRAFLSVHDTTLPRFDVMAALERYPHGLRMSDLSRELLVSNGNVTGIVHGLKRDGLVELLSVANDRRASLARLTVEGQRQFSALSASHHQWVVSMLQDMTPVQLSALHQLLGTLKSSLATNTGPEDA